jgi:hypothetical protein
VVDHSLVLVERSGAMKAATILRIYQNRSGIAQSGEFGVRPLGMALNPSRSFDPRHTQHGPA